MAKCSSKMFESLLVLFAEILLKDTTLPLIYYTMKTLMKKLNLGYEKFDACPKIICCTREMIHPKLFMIFMMLLVRKLKTKRERRTKQDHKGFFLLIPRPKRLYMSDHLV